MESVKWCSENPGLLAVSLSESVFMIMYFIVDAYPIGYNVSSHDHGCGIGICDSLYQYMYVDVK